MDDAHNIVIARKKLIFERLYFGTVFDREGVPERWRGDTATKKVMTTGFSGEPAELPMPLCLMCLNMNREGEFYSGKVMIIPESRRFWGLSRVLQKNFMPARFSPTRRFGLGYLFLPGSPDDGLSDFTIGMQDENFEIHAGDGGARPRKFSERGSFEADLGQLESVVDIFVKSCYELAKKPMSSLPKYVTLTC